MSVKNPQLAGFLLTQNRSNYLNGEGSTAWLYDCPHKLSPLYIADKCYDRIPVHYLETVKYVDPITRQTFDYATPIACENNPQNTIALDLDSDQYYLLTPEPIKQDPPRLFQPTQIKTAISPNTFSAQDAGIYSSKELSHFWSRVLFAKHSDTTIELLGKAITYDFINDNTGSQSPYFKTKHYSNPYGKLRYGFEDRVLNLLPFLAPGWFAAAFIEQFGKINFFLTQCGIYFSLYLFLRTVATFFMQIFRAFNIKTILKTNITVASALAHGFFGLITPQIANSQHKSINQIDNSFSDNDDNSHSYPLSLPQKKPIKFNVHSSNYLPLNTTITQNPLSQQPNTTTSLNTLPPPPEYQSSTSFFFPVLKI